MPTIEDTSQESALRLARAAEPLSPPDDQYRIVSGYTGTVWEVSDALHTAYQADLPNPAPIEPACRSNAPCYSDPCYVEPPPVASVLSTVAPPTVVGDSTPKTFTLTGSGFKPTSKGRVGSTDQQTTYVSPTQLTVSYGPAAFNGVLNWTVMTDGLQSNVVTSQVTTA